MIYTAVNASLSAVLRIPDSLPADSVTYSILRASDGSTFATGAAISIGSGLWKVTFTPLVVDETYVLTLNDTPRDVQTSESYKATVSSIPTVVAPTPPAVTAAELLVKVTAAISSILTGGAVQSYMIGGRNVMYMSLDQLTRLRDNLRKEVSSGRTGTRLFATFSNPL